MLVHQTPQTSTERTYPRAPYTSETPEALHDARALLDAGDLAGARTIAQSLLAAATQSHNSGGEAKALSLLAHCDRMASRFRRAHDTSQRAAHLFKSVGDLQGEVDALATQAHSASALGRNEEAVEAALLSVRLGDGNVPTQAAIASRVPLGVAYFFSRSFDKANEVLDDAVEMARNAQPALSPFQALVTKACAESIRIFLERYRTGRVVELERLQKVLEACTANNPSAELGALPKGVQISAHGLWHLAAAAWNGWAGCPDEAERELVLARAWMSKFGLPTALDALHELVVAELAAFAGDWDRAARYAESAISVATQVEHEQFACIAHQLASLVYEAQGQNALALSELRRLSTREQHIRSESIESRARVVGWQIDLRRGENSLRELETSATHLAKLSYEDALTGLANRRRFEQRLHQALRELNETGTAFSVAVIDIDKFKQVNDGFSHQVGDEVLREISRLLEGNVREVDLPARLAGDEFVIVFSKSGAEEAAEACRRIVAAVQHFDWGVIAKGLKVSISVGVSTAQNGDTYESLFGRGDSAMYRHKRVDRTVAE